MRIWIDLTNSPHVPFFARMIRELSAEHDVVLTCRPLANTVDLLDQHGFSYDVVGRHYGARRVAKALGFAVRVTQLYRFLRRDPPDVAISHSSFYSPIVAWMLGAPSVYLNDNEHAAGNTVSFRFATKVLVPETADVDTMRRQGARDGQIETYPGVKEGVYLWALAVPERATHERPRVFLRPEPWAAQYYQGRRDFLDELLLGLKGRADVTVLPRGEAQAAHYRDDRLGVTVPDRSLPLADIAAACDVFVGAGGTMTRELAVLGVPTVSIYQDSLLGVDRYLIERGYMVHQPEPTPDSVLEHLHSTVRKPPSDALLDEGRAAWEQIRDTLLRLGQESAP